MWLIVCRKIMLIMIPLNQDGYKKIRQVGFSFSFFSILGVLVVLEVNLLFPGFPETLLIWFNIVISLWTCEFILLGVYSAIFLKRNRLNASSVQGDIKKESG